MGWKFDSNLTDAQRNMLRQIQRDPYYKPKSTTTRKRLQTLIEKGYVEVNARGRKTVYPKLADKPEDA